MRSLLAAAALSLMSIVPTALAADLPTQTRPVTLVELFTSQGCHSCPPADALLTRMERAARRNDRPISFLAFHVDYWNRLGWADPFSDAAYSNRQRAYAVAFNNRSVYTPQMVVDGRREFVGSDAVSAQRAIARADDPDASGPSLALRRLAVDGRRLTIDVDAAGIPTGAHLFAALSDGPHATAVPRGENAGKTLRETAVVRAFGSAPARPDTTVRIEVPEGIDPDSARLTVWLQDPATMWVHHAVATTRPLRPTDG
ncbi:MAG: DUF1223 domain-containing protein [Planctomycetota bacterium]